MARCWLRVLVKIIAKRLKRSGIIVLVSFCAFLPVLAKAQVYQMDVGKRVSITVAEEGLNRVVIFGDRIAKVVGDGELYTIEGEPIHGFVFFKSRVSAPHIIAITIITEKRKVIDLNIEVQALKEPQTVILKWREKAKK